MLYANFKTYVLKLCRTDDSSFTDAMLAIYANQAKDEISRLISQANENIFGIQMQRDLIAGQRNYAFEESILNNVFYLEAQLAPTIVGGIVTVDDWHKLIEYDLHQFRDLLTDETNLALQMAAYQPGFMIMGGQVYILSADPILDVDNGLKMFANIYPSDFTLASWTVASDMSTRPSATEFGIPKGFHDLLARRTSMKWKASQEKPIQLTMEERRYDNDLETALDTISPANLDREYLVTTPYDDGSNY